MGMTTKNISSKVVLLLSIMFFAVGGFLVRVEDAFAAVLYSNTGTPDTAYGYGGQFSPTSSDTLSDVEMYVDFDWFGSLAASGSGYFYIYNDSSSSVLDCKTITQSAVDWVADGASSREWNQSYSPAPAPLDLQFTGTQCAVSTGTNYSVRTSGFSRNPGAGGMSGSGTLYQVVYSGGIFPPYEDTHINSLSPNAVSTTSPMTFTLDFHQGTTTPAQRINISLFDPRISTTGNAWIDADIPLSFSQDADHTYSAQLVLYPLSNWLMRASLYDEEENLIEATTTSFTIASDSSGYGDYDPLSGVSTTTPGGFQFNLPELVGATVGTSTIASSTNLLNFLNVPTMLKTKVPFAYIYQVGTTLTDAISSTSPATIPSGSFDIHLPIGNSSTTISVNMFSTTTITYFLNPTAIGIIRGLMVAVTYTSLGLFLFHDARDKRHLI